MSNIINPQIIECQNLIDTLYMHLNQLTNDINNDDLHQTVKNIRSKLGEPFLFVIVGEVKAGKSSFINALLKTGREICKVAPDPCTDTIQQIIYGEKEEIFEINEHLKKITLPVDILQNISIVDTPGTNTISDHHQEITERFVPHSDLIVFVFEAKNPYRQSAWEFFDYINAEWRKKVIFILQQADLMSPENLQINIEGVRKQAVVKGIEEPRIYATSALYEQEGRENISGFSPLREYILNNITGGNSLKLKMESNVSTATQVISTIEKGLKLRKEQLAADQKFRGEIKSAMDEQENKSFQRIEQMVKELLTDYDRITTNIRHEFTSGISFFNLAGRSLKSMFSSDEKNVKEWLSHLTKKMEGELRTNFQDKLENRMNEISDSIKQMVKIVDMKMKSSQNILATDHEIFGDIADKRQDAIKTIQKNYIDFVNNTENFVDRKLFPSTSSLAPNVAAGGGLAVVGAILAASSQAAVFDITGGIVAALGISLAGITLLFSKRKVIKEFDAEIAKGREQLERVLNIQIKEYTHKIKTRLDQNFDPLDVHIKQESESLNNLNAQINKIEGGLEQINSKLRTLKV